MPRSWLVVYVEEQGRGFGQGCDIPKAELRYGVWGGQNGSTMKLEVSGSRVVQRSRVDMVLQM